VLLATVLSSGLVFLDGAVINVALPAIDQAFHPSHAMLQWLITGYLLPLAALQLLAGALGDHFGRRRTLAAGVLLFLIASLVCAAAANIAVLLVARVAQGAGAALIVPNSLAVLGSAFLSSERTRAVGIWTSASAGVASLGPPLGGWLVDIVSWRCVFLLNIPLGIAALTFVFRSVRDPSTENLPIDARGSLLGTIALALLTLALTQWSVLTAGLAAAVFVWFKISERQLGEDGIMPTKLFASKAYLGLSIYTFLLYSSFGALFVLLPFVLMTSARYSAMAAGAALLPLPIVIGALSGPVGRLRSIGNARIPLALGSMVAAIGYLLLMRVGSGDYWTDTFPGLSLIAGGMAVVMTPQTVAVLNSVDEADTATAAGVNSAISRIGSLLAIAAGGSVMVGDAATSLASFHAAAFIGAILVALAALFAMATLQSASPVALVQHGRTSP
jgi:MFS family permease